MVGVLSLATLNGEVVLGAQVREPRVGAWTAELDVDSEQELSGSVTLDIADEQWLGTVVRGALEAGHYHCVIVGGAGKLGTTLQPKHYVSAPMRVMLSEILSGAGETQAQSSDADVGSRFVDRWSRMRGSAGQALRQVADDLGVSWRVLRDGTIWLGLETWPDAASVDYTEIERLPGRGRVLIAPDAPVILPGTSWQGQRVSEVKTVIDEQGLRQELTFEDDAIGPFDRALQRISRVVDSLVGRRIDYANIYPSQVVDASSGDGSVELLPDDERVRGTGIARVPLRPGLPGTTLKLKPGSRVALYFEAGDVKKPAASLWDAGAGVLEITVEAETKLTLVAPTVRVEGDLEVTGEVTAKAGETGVALTTHVHPTAMGPSSPPTAPS